MKLTDAKVLKHCRSGHTFWRVWAWPMPDGSIHLDIRAYRPIGKMVVHYGHKAFRCKALKNNSFEGFTYPPQNGLSTFTKKRQAEKFGEDFLAGRYPELRKVMLDYYENLHRGSLLSERRIATVQWSPISDSTEED